MRDKTVRKQLERVSNALESYREPSKTNDIKKKYTCVKCRKAYLEQLLCDHEFKPGSHNTSYCAKCSFDSGKITDTCFGEGIKHVSIEEVQKGDKCIACGFSEKNHAGQFPCTSFPSI